MGYFDAPNWGAKDRSRYQQELDDLVLAGHAGREAERERRFRVWLDEHAHAENFVLGMTDGLVCETCGEKFGG